MVWFTEWLIHQLRKLPPLRRVANHIVLGHRGEQDAYFYLSRLGYRIVATNYRVTHDRGEIDLIGWDGDVLCFIEVKSRTDDSFAPPSTAVTREKQSHIRAVARAYLRRIAAESRPPCRFDVVSVVPSSDEFKAHITLRRAAFSWNSGHKRRLEFRDYLQRRSRRDTRNLPTFR